MLIKKFEGRFVTALNSEAALTLIHVIGQISYKKNCLSTVIDHLNSWDNKDLVNKSVEEIIDVHHRYKNFAAMTQEQALEFIKRYVRN